MQRSTLFYDDAVIGTIDGAFVSDGTWFGDFHPASDDRSDDRLVRLREFIEFCREWHARLATDDADASEFDRFADLISSGLWHVRMADGSDQKIFEAPVFIGNEISWRTE